MVGWHHRVNEHEIKQILGDGEGQGSLCLESGRIRHDWVTEQQQISIHGMNEYRSKNSDFVHVRAHRIGKLNNQAKESQGSKIASGTPLDLQSCRTREDQE